MHDDDCQIGWIAFTCTRCERDLHLLLLWIQSNHGANFITESLTANGFTRSTLSMIGVTRPRSTVGGSPRYPAVPLKSASSTRRAKVPSAVRPGEQWAHPGDTGAMWPGVSASHRANPVPPALTGGDDMVPRDYRWMLLARRVDLDRVLNTLLEFPSMFKNVKVTGEGVLAHRALGRQLEVAR